MSGDATSTTQFTIGFIMPTVGNKRLVESRQITHGWLFCQGVGKCPEREKPKKIIINLQKVRGLNGLVPFRAPFMLRRCGNVPKIIDGKLPTEILKGVPVVLFVE